MEAEIKIIYIMLLYLILITRVRHEIAMNKTDIRVIIKKKAENTLHLHQNQNQQNNSKK